MGIIRILTLESNDDAKAVECLAAKLAKHLQIGNLSIQASGKRALLIDQDSPRSLHQRRQEPNSLINQIEAVINERSLAGKVFLVLAVQELEAWLLIDCLGIFCYFASQRAQYRENCRHKVSRNRPLSRLIDRYQRGNTEAIVEVEVGGRGPKEYLVEFSEEVLLKLNPNMPNRNITGQRYHEAISPEVAAHVDINQLTLRCNNSLRKLGDVLARFR